MPKLAEPGAVLDAFPVLLVAVVIVVLVVGGWRARDCHSADSEPRAATPLPSPLPVDFAVILPLHEHRCFSYTTEDEPTLSFNPLQNGPGMFRSAKTNEERPEQSSASA